MKKYVLSFAVLIFATTFSTTIVKASDQSDVRATVESVFDQLKSHDYGSLYDFLPGSARSRSPSISLPWCW